jgi:hypothetical protein
VHVGTRVSERAEAEKREPARDISKGFSRGWSDIQKGHRPERTSSRKDIVAKEELV